MARPRKVVKAAERARVLHRQLAAAYKVLSGLRGCLEKLSKIEVDPVYARLDTEGRRTPFGDYRYLVLRLCQSPSEPSIYCESAHTTRFPEFAKAFVEAAEASVALAELREASRRALRLLEGLEQLLARLSEETRRVEEYGRRLEKPKEAIEAGEVASW